MQHDLSNPSTMTTSTPPLLARVAQRVLVLSSLVLAVGLAGVVFARNAADHQHESGPRILWIGRGTTVVIDRPEPFESPAAVHTADAETVADEVQESPEPEPEPQPAAMTLVAESILPRVILMEVTAYCPCTHCCGPQAQGITASGKHVSYNDGKFVAADTRVLPFGTKLVIPGYGEMQPVEVIDRGGAIKGHKLDVFFPTHEEALQWGRQKLEVVIEG